MSDGSRSKPGSPNRLQQGISGAEFAGIGIQFALSILIFVFAGVWLDRRLHSSPWFVLICVFVGAAGGFYSMYRRVTMAQKRDAEERRNRRTSPGA